MSTEEHTLAELAQRLEANGMVVVRFKDYIEIRLPLFASVKVRIVDGRLSCEPRFGFLPRERATWVTIVGLAAVTATSFLDLGVTALSMVFGFLTVSSGASTAVRYQVTEACITRVQTAFMLMTPGNVRDMTTPERPRELGDAAPEFMAGRRDPVPLRKKES